MISSTSLAPWIPPTVMQTEVIDLATSGNAFTLGGLFYCGLMKVVDTYTGEDVAEQVMDQNVVFGDASLRVRTTTPGSFTVSGPTDLPRTNACWTGQVRGPAGSLGTLVTTDGIVAMATVDATGGLNLDGGALPAGVDSVTLTISGHNMTPYVRVFSLAGETLPDPDSDDDDDSNDLGEALPTQVTLRGNYPNPFNPSTTIAFDLPRAMRVRLSVFDIRGHLVRSLLDETLPAGANRVPWDGTGNGGDPVASGMYLYRLDTPDGTRQGRMTLSK
ncbi:hypothetical protein CSA17_05200 [bacterium DOLJORAL78_65_58]|nr:MAG: hypothetical protein CSA17_05200 [bacterium DOLJORAL78_65_58]